MTLADSLLLQVSKQKTSYNDLLARILPNYSSKNSAKAALSRAIKNLIAFGSIKNENDYYVLTFKGKKIIESKLKNQILININNVVSKIKYTNNLELLDDVVTNLQIFLERSKQDKTLLKVGKTSSSFYISDLKNISKLLDNKINHLNHLQNIFEKQILMLQELNFEDVKICKLNSTSFLNIKSLVDFYNTSEILIEVDNEELLNLFLSNYIFKQKSNNVFKLKIEDLNKFKDFVFTNLELLQNSKLKIYIHEILIVITNNKMRFTGPQNVIVDIE